jgi:hypothetical protein
LREFPGFRSRGEPVRSAQKRAFRWLAGPRKRHYTFARRRPDRHVTVQARHGVEAASKH